MEDIQRRARRRDIRLTKVTVLDLSDCPHDANVMVGLYIACNGLALILPNLRELDLSYLPATWNVVPVEAFCRSCPQLTKFTWNGSCTDLNLSGQDFDHSPNLAELYVDGALFTDFVNDRRAWGEEWVDDTDTACYMLMECAPLERLSIKNTSLTSVSYYAQEAQPVSQEIIMKFVRHTPTLRWLRSDLTEENVAILHQERPNVKFVMD
jgi:Leucine-rich repeat (LRR) protein